MSAETKTNELVGKIDKFNSCKKMQQFGKIKQLEVNMRYTPFENMNAVKEITQFMIAHDLPKERVIEVLNDTVSMIGKKPNYYFSRENIEYTKQQIIKRFIKNDKYL